MADKFIEYRKKLSLIEQKKYNDSLVFDKLTGFYQRLVWEDEGNHILSHAKRNMEKVAMVFIDLNNLKKVNDNENWGGHFLGDLYVKSVSEAIKHSIRYEDIVGRLGGDEFGILLSGMAEDDVQSLVIRIKNNMAEILASDSRFEKVPKNILSISTGFSVWDGRENISELVARADTEMYKDKRESKVIKTRPTKTYVAE